MDIDAKLDATKLAADEVSSGEAAPAEASGGAAPAEASDERPAAPVVAEWTLVGHDYVGRRVARSVFRAARFVPVRIAYDAMGLQARIDGSVLVQDLLISTWAPQPTWRFGLGARTGEARTDEHRVDNLWPVVGAEAEPTAAWSLLR